MRRYEGLKDKGDPKTLQTFADRHKVNLEDVESAAATLRMIDRNLKIGANIDVDFHKKYKRVRVGKLLVPRSFATHCDLICELMDIREEAFWQMIMMEAMALYADKAADVIELANKTISKEEPSAEPSADNTSVADIAKEIVQGDDS